MADCGTSTANRESFKNFGNEYKQGDDQRRKDFTDRQSGYDGDSHRKLHRHAALNDVFVGFVEYWKATNERTEYAESRYIGTVHPRKPNRPRRCGHKQHAVDISPIQRMFVLVAVFVWRL